MRRQHPKIILENQAKASLHSPEHKAAAACTAGSWQSRRCATSLSCLVSPSAASLAPKYCLCSRSRRSSPTAWRAALYRPSPEHVPSASCWEFWPTQGTSLVRNTIQTTAASQSKQRTLLQTVHEKTGKWYPWNAQEWPDWPKESTWTQTEWPNDLIKLPSPYQRSTSLQTGHWPSVHEHEQNLFSQLPCEFLLELFGLRS